MRPHAAHLPIKIEIWKFIVRGEPGEMASSLHEQWRSEFGDTERQARVTRDVLLKLTR